MLVLRKNRSEIFWVKLIIMGSLCQLVIFLMIIIWSTFIGIPFSDLQYYNGKVYAVRTAREIVDGAVNDQESKIPRNVGLFVAILTHAKRRLRRDAIRETWLSACMRRPSQVECRFFTDEVGLDDESKLALRNESKVNRDMGILLATDSFAFAERLLLIWEWASMKKLTFDFFLRIDDDHFLCLERLLHELEYRPRVGLYWGFVHCKPRVVRVDEAWLMITRDLVEEIMIKRSNKTLLCHPYGDQSVAMWINKSNRNISYFMDNQRIMHKSAGRDPKYFKKDICQKYLSLHGAYPKSMRQFWLLTHKLRRRENQTVIYEVPEIKDFSKLCKLSPIFDYKAFILEYQFQPKLCHTRPRWSISKTFHRGREEEGERYTNY